MSSRRREHGFSPETSDGSTSQAGATSKPASKPRNSTPAASSSVSDVTPAAESRGIQEVAREVANEVTKQFTKNMGAQFEDVEQILWVVADIIEKQFRESGVPPDTERKELARGLGNALTSSFMKHEARLVHLLQMGDWKELHKFVAGIAERFCDIMTVSKKAKVWHVDAALSCVGVWVACTGWLLVVGRAIAGF